MYIFIKYFHEDMISFILCLFSLNLDSFTGVREIDVEFTETPVGCMGALGVTEAEAVLRETIMNGLNVNNTDVASLLEMKPKDRVCNMHVIDDEGYADFKYYCCFRNLHDDLECEYLKEDFWVNILMVIIKILQVLIVLFAPIYIPEAYYMLKDYGTPYAFKLAKDVKMHLNIMVANNSDAFKGESNAIKCSLSKFKHMHNFKNILGKLKFNTKYRMELEDVHIRAAKDTLLPEHVIPVGLWSKLYRTFVMCNLRKAKGFRNCCYAEVCVKSPCGVRVTWYRVLRSIMMFCTSFVFISPWIIRVALYFFYEHEDMSMRRTAAGERHLEFWFPGSYTLYVTPLHFVFIIIYVLLSIEYCIFGVMGERVQNKFKYVLQACFKDMRNRDKGEVLSWAFNFALRPCTKYGFFGIFTGLIAWALGLPFMCLFLAFYLLPTVNITFRLMAHFIAYLSRPKSSCSSPILDSYDPDHVVTSEKLVVEENIMKNMCSRILQLCVILFCIVSLYSLLFLLTEIAAVAVEIIVYTLMGLILNASKLLAFVSLFFLLAVYGTECFGHVKTKFLVFNQALNKAILKLGEDKCKEIMYQSYREQGNNAFMVSTESSTPIGQSVDIECDLVGNPRWQTSRLVLFFSKHDVPQIPMSLFFNACKMPYDFVPGSVLKNYVKAAVEFGVILVFLIFVFLVVAAFGDTYQLSTSNQLLATVVGGLLPKLLQKVFKSHESPKIDDKSIQFKVFLYELLEDYDRDWPIYDFITKSDPIEIESSAPKRSSVSSSTSYLSAGIGSPKDDSEALLNGHATEMQEIKRHSDSHLNERETGSTEPTPNGKAIDTMPDDEVADPVPNGKAIAELTETTETEEPETLLVDTEESLGEKAETGTDEGKTVYACTYDLIIDASKIDKDGFPWAELYPYDNVNIFV